TSRCGLHSPCTTQEFQPTTNQVARHAGELFSSLLANQEPRHDRVNLLDVLAARGFWPSTFDDWLRIDAAEANRGASHDRERMKIEAWHELLDLVQRERPGGPLPPD
ncbi:hypothetical protein, partial [Micropruina glycogenica]|uniref:hypothetical protein n=1 Tax=Micropruina glycogenica TaxID=75385 RepID=UPI0031D22BE9